ncbi:phage I-like protein [Rhodobium orientis]|uniref:Uncharacterized protein n=1 Tax=Rhodobium orientis TaxID=34017 RepID=A0A327JMM6_9HYPH|nr:phage protease [Rhodobium orientis]MBB4302344.1 phage I-like protein [Rhodobium orientis]MBK5949049.1 hypothetical protein [Rhodobium orientis]RAI26623.1 hypothetical protein CH339_13565 [Rhodobium orientis]
MTLETARAAFATAFEAASAPSEAQLFPAGPAIEGRDGRSWRLSDPAAVVAAFKANKAPLVIDYEHASFLKADSGEEAPAAGWITDVFVKPDNSIWGSVEWTERASGMIARREYRFLSPEFVFDRDTREISRLRAAGLVNRPALELAALAKEKEDPAMNLTAICSALGLVAAASPEQVLEAIEKLKGERDTARSEAETAIAAAKTPPIDKFVPRADYDKVKEDLATARAETEATRKAEHDKKVAAAIDAAVKAGKIAPASKDHYVALCKTDDGFKSFEQLVATMPVIGDGSGLDGQDPQKPAGALTGEEKAICAQLGISEADYAKDKAAVAA